MITKAHCWFCDEDKEVEGFASSTSLAYGFPFPVMELTVKSRQIMDGEVVSFVCRDCRSAILQAIAGSGVASKGKVLAVSRTMTEFKEGIKEVVY